MSYSSSGSSWNENGDYIKTSFVIKKDKVNNNVIVNKTKLIPFHNNVIIRKPTEKTTLLGWELWQYQNKLNALKNNKYKIKICK